MLESTGSHGRGVERRVPEMRRMVEFNCTSTRLVWAERDQTGAQYSDVNNTLHVLLCTIRKILLWFGFDPLDSCTNLIVNFVYLKKNSSTSVTYMAYCR